MSDIISTASETHRQVARPRFVDTRLFGWVDLGCACIAGVLWYVSNGALGPWPLLIAGIPWVARLANKRLPVRRTRLDPLLLAFLLSALFSSWIGYNQIQSWDKLWLIVGSIVIFYAVAGQHPDNIWPIVLGVGLFSLAVAVYFLMTNDWQSAPAKIEFINDLAMQWGQIRPTALSGLHHLHPNVAGGIMAMLFPLAMAGGIFASREWRWGGIIAAAMISILIGVSLIMTTSRGALLALACGLAAWLMWVLAGRLDKRLFLSRRQTLTLTFAVIFGVGLTVVLLAPGGLVGLLDALPGPANAGSRLTISRDAVSLIGDFPFVGAGLGSFDGLYSQYIRVIPNHYLIHSHNFFLDVGVEQGLLGLILVLMMMGAAFWWLSDPTQSDSQQLVRRRSLLSGALFATLVVLCVHGLVEDPLYGSRALLLLWLPLGLTSTLFAPLTDSRSDAERMRINRLGLVVAGLTLIAVAGSMLMSRTNLMAMVEATSGALEMARVELVDYPTNEWSDGHEAAQLQDTRTRFDRALVLNPANRTAWHRLGLIAMSERDYETAARSLREAYRLDPQHPGIRKSLAYSLIWSGQLDDGVRLIAQFPEAQVELSAYVWWWEEKGQKEFSVRAEEALEMLEATAPSP